MAHTVFITGGDCGLGFGLCAGFLAQGYRVIAGQYLPDWTELSALMQQFPGILHIIPLDVRFIESVQRATQAAVAKAIPFFLNPRANEDRLALVDVEGTELPW